MDSNENRNTTIACPECHVVLTVGEVRADKCEACGHAGFMRQKVIARAKVSVVGYSVLIGVLLLVYILISIPTYNFILFLSPLLSWWWRVIIYCLLLGPFVGIAVFICRALQGKGMN